MARSTCHLISTLKNSTMNLRIPDASDVLQACPIVHRHLTPVPLIRSLALQRHLGLPAHRQVWIKDYGWSPVGSFKVYGALRWMAEHAPTLGDRPVAAHSSGNFASGLAFAARQFGKRAILVMPDTAPKIKFQITQSFGAQVLTYQIATDHLTGIRDQMTRQIAEQEKALQASPYDDPMVIAGNGVGGWEIVQTLQSQQRSLSHFLCAVSGGGLMAGHALAIHAGFPDAKCIGVEPEGADDYRRSLAAQQRTRLDHPSSICDGLLSYDVGQHNWPILREHVPHSVAVSDQQTCDALAWLYRHHGLRAEPSGVVTLAALLQRSVDIDASDGDIVCVLSGRNIDEETFQKYLAQAASSS